MAATARGSCVVSGKDYLLRHSHSQSCLGETPPEKELMFMGRETRRQRCTRV